MKKYIKIILLLIFLVIFIFSGYKVINYLIEANKNKKLNNNLIEKAITILDNNQDDENKIPFSVDFNTLQQENKDIVGWIYSKDTPINYPVVQSSNNEDYLRKLITGEYNTAGSLFMDYRNNSDLSDQNTIIYGHNMKNATMFGTLQNYRNQDYYDEHKIMYYFTPTGNYLVKIATAYTASVESVLYKLTDLNQDNINNIMKQSNFKSEVSINESDKILTLSTCAYEYEDARFIVVGVLQPLSE